MKIGFVAFPNPAEGYVEFAVKHGFEHIEVDLYSTAQWLESFRGERVRRLKKLCEDAKLPLSFHAPYTINLAEHLPTLRRAVLGYFERLIKIACEAGAKWVVAHPGYGMGPPHLAWVRTAALDRLKESLEHLLPLFERAGMTFCIENINPLPKGSTLIYLGDSVQEMQTMLSEFDSPHLRMCLDVGHANTAEGALTYIEALHSKIITTHVHDNDGLNDEHEPLGEGTVPWDEVITKFKQVGFSGPLNIELFEDRHKVEGKPFLETLLKKHGIR